MEVFGIKFVCVNLVKLEKIIEILNNIVSEEEVKLEFERYRVNSFFFFFGMFKFVNKVVIYFCFLL